MKNKSVDLLRAATFSQGNYNKPVAIQKREHYAALIDNGFENATDFMIVEEEIKVGSCCYDAVGARVTHAITSSISTTFANECKKIIFQDFDHEQYLGKKYRIKDQIWLTTDLNEITNLSSHSYIRLCNNVLKWYDPNDSSKLYVEPCVFTNQFTNTAFDDGKESVIQISGDFQILVQLNERTKTIEYNQRFVLNGLSFQVTQYDNHRSNTFLIMKVKQIDIKANDNVVDNIANDTQGIKSNLSEIKILPQVIKILQGEKQEFSVYRYEDGEQTGDTFDIIPSQAPRSAYEIEIFDGNSFAITNKMKCPIPLKISCIDDETDEEVTMNIVLGGMY